MPQPLPWNFPPAADRLAAEGRRFQALPSSERVKRLCRLIDDGRSVLVLVRPDAERLADRERLAAECRTRIRDLLERQAAR